MCRPTTINATATARFVLYADEPVAVVGSFGVRAPVGVVSSFAVGGMPVAIAANSLHVEHWSVLHALTNA